MGSIVDAGGPAPAAQPAFQLVDRFIDEPRPLRVAVIGGGIAGINAGILLPAKVPGIQLTIYEKNKDLAGTWFENTYPGVRCDIPSHVYQSTFAPKTDWTDVFSFGPEIRDYWQGVARKYGVYQYAQLGRSVEDSTWDDATGTWSLTVRDVDTGATTTATFDAIVTAVGRFNNWQLPDYPGIEDYRGVLRHVQNWDPAFDPAGKRVAVIGNGASGIQLVTNLQKKVGRLDHYARNRTWIAASFAGDERRADAQPYPPEQVATFEKDPEAYLAFRKDMEAKYWRRFGELLKHSESNEAARQKFTEIMRTRVTKKPELLQDLIPDFSPNCRRPTPGPGYLEALTEDNVDYIRTPIKRFTATGIETEDGVLREVDAVFCATGSRQDLVFPFPVRARGQTIEAVWGAPTKTIAPNGTVTTTQGRGYPYTYLGVATPGFPNLFFLQGPNSSGLSGTVPHSSETQVTYVARLLRKLAFEGVRAMAPSAAAADDFVEYANAFFATTVLSEPCSSWYNGRQPGGFIHGAWPGSAGHLTAVRREPRWEDWEYAYEGDAPGRRANRFAQYFGNGWTRKEADADSDIVPYLHVPGTVDLKDLHESWWQLP